MGGYWSLVEFYCPFPIDQIKYCFPISVDICSPLFDKMQLNNKITKNPTRSLAINCYYLCPVDTFGDILGMTSRRGLIMDH